jgi:hypothetical protein
VIEGTFFSALRIVNQPRMRTSKRSARGNYLEIIMDAKWNNIVDNGLVRIGMVAAVFVIWLAVSYGLLWA